MAKLEKILEKKFKEREKLINILDNAQGKKEQCESELEQAFESGDIDRYTECQIRLNNYNQFIEKQNIKIAEFDKKQYVDRLVFMEEADKIFMKYGAALNKSINELDKILEQYNKKFKECCELENNADLEIKKLTSLANKENLLSFSAYDSKEFKEYKEYNVVQYEKIYINSNGELLKQGKKVYYSY